MNRNLAQIIAMVIAGYAKDIPSINRKHSDGSEMAYNGTNSSFKQNRRIQLKHGFKHRGKR